jgi:hypothetical protein
VRHRGRWSTAQWNTRDRAPFLLRMVPGARACSCLSERIQPSAQMMQVWSDVLGQWRLGDVDEEVESVRFDDSPGATQIDFAGIPVGQLGSDSEIA